MPGPGVAAVLRDAVPAALAFEVPQQVLFSGAMRGLAVGVLAVGVILVYRSCRVINFALGELGALAAALFVRLVLNWHWNFYAALAVMVAAGALAGAILELGLVRRLAKAPRVVLLVATIGAAQLLLFLQFVLPDLARNDAFPTAFTERWTVGDVIVRAEHAVALVVLPAVVAALGWFLSRTKHGVAVRAAADNPDAARLAGISVTRVSTIVWSLAGALAALSTILSAPLVGASTAGTGDLGPPMLLRTFAAAVIAGMASLPVALAAGLAIGVVEAVVFYNHADDPGVVNVVLCAIVLVAVLAVSLRHRDLGVREAFSFAPRVRPVPAVLRRWWLVRHHTRVGAGLALAAAVVLPLFVTSASRQYLYANVLVMALVALSLTVLTGWAGQLSLGQFALVGIGGMTTYALVQERLMFPAAVLAGAAVAAAAALVVGAPALRMRGLFLAVTTLALAVAAPWVVSRRIFLGEGGFDPLLRRPVVLGVDLSDQRTYYWLCLAVLVVTVLVVAQVRRTGVGRALLAVRDNELSAAAMGLSPTRVKLTAFGLSGALAGLAGGCLVGLVEQFRADRAFPATESLTIVAIAVVGGLSSITGAVLGSVVIVGLPAFFPDSPEVELLTSGIGLLLLLLYFPGGLVQILYRARDAMFGALADRLPEPERAPTPAVPALRRPAAGAVDPAVPALAAKDVTVRFGARTVVDRVTFTLRQGEVLGLIGANGAGKSTLMNAIGGYVHSTGTVEVLGRPATGRAPHRRAALGLGRSFQDAALFPDLTVRETVAVAAQARRRPGLATVTVGFPLARRIERATAAHTDEVLSYLGLGAYADRFISELSTGMRRIVELACLLATEARVLCLDEPTAGIAQREAEAFGPLLLRVRAELDASMLVIEHDMPLVMSISDRIVCLEAGAVVAEGTPHEIRHDPRVVASYLGTDEQAIARSDAGLSAPTAR